MFSLDGNASREIDYRETPHFLITRDFLNSPERFFRHLVETVDDTQGGPYGRSSGESLSTKR